MGRRVSIFFPRFFVQERCQFTRFEGFNSRVGQALAKRRIDASFERAIHASCVNYFLQK